MSDLQIPLKAIVRCPQCGAASYLRVGNQPFSRWILDRLIERGEMDDDRNPVDYQHCRCTCGWEGLVQQVVKP